VNLGEPKDGAYGKGSVPFEERLMALGNT